VCKVSLSVQLTEIPEVAVRRIFLKQQSDSFCGKCLLLKAYKLQAVSASFKTELESQAALVLL
jgi:hypothetical protein